MDRLLLDTHVVLWALDDHPKLSLRARSAITDPANEVFVSAASIWEIAIKRSIGKLQAPDSITSWVEASGFLELPVTSFHAEQLATSRSTTETPLTGCSWLKHRRKG